MKRTCARRARKVTCSSSRSVSFKPREGEELLAERIRRILGHHAFDRRDETNEHHLVVEPDGSYRFGVVVGRDRKIQMVLRRDAPDGVEHRVQRGDVSLGDGVRTEPRRGA